MAMGMGTAEGSATWVRQEPRAAALGAAEDQSQPPPSVLMIPELARKHLGDGLFSSRSQAQALSNASHAARREMKYFSCVTAGSVIH